MKAADFRHLLEQMDVRDVASRSRYNSSGKLMYLSPELDEIYEFVLGQAEQKLRVIDKANTTYFLGTPCKVAFKYGERKEVLQAEIQEIKTAYQELIDKVKALSKPKPQMFGWAVVPR